MIDGDREIKGLMLGEVVKGDKTGVICTVHACKWGAVPVHTRPDGAQ